MKVNSIVQMAPFVLPSQSSHWISKAAAQAAESHSGQKLMVGSAVVADEVRIASQPHHGSKGMLTNRYMFCEQNSHVGVQNYYTVI